MLIKIVYIVFNLILFYYLSFSFSQKIVNLLRPVVGFSIFILWISISYRFGLPIIYGYVIAAMLSIYFFIKNSHIDTEKIYPIIIIVAAFSILASIGSETYHAAQGHGYDRYSYMVASEVAKNYNYSEIRSAFKDLFGFGNNTLIIQDYLTSRSMGDYTTRPAASFTFTATSSMFPSFQYQLGSSFESLPKLLLILTTIGIGTRHLKSIKLSIFAGIIIGFSYWTQYSKDANAWSMFLMMPFLLLLIDNIISYKKIGLIDYLLITTCLLIYPEGVIFIIGGTSILLLYILNLQENYIKFFLKNMALLILISTLVYLINPYIFLHIKRAFAHTGLFSLTDAAYNVRDIICYDCNYSNLESYASFIDNFSKELLIKYSHILIEIPMYFLGVFGYISIEKFIGPFTIIFFITILYFLTIKNIFKSSENIILLIINLIALQIILFITGKFYGWSRAVNYTSLIINVYFILIILKNINYKTGLFLLISYIILTLNFQFGFLKNIIYDTNSYNKLFKYTWMKDSISWL